MANQMEQETTVVEEKGGQPTLPVTTPMDKRKMELREILKQYTPNKNVYYAGSAYDSTTLSEMAKSFLKSGSGIIVEDGNFFVSEYDDVDILTIDFFYALASTIGRRFVMNAICGPDAVNKLPIEGFPSHLADTAATFQLAFYYAARHGYFYPNAHHDVYSHAYSSIFAMAFTEYDDIFRIRLNRRLICEDIVRWDSRATEDINEVYNRVINSDDDEERAQLGFLKKIKENAEAYQFQGESRLGTFITGMGYFPPGQKLPIYRTIVRTLYSQEDDNRTEERMNLDAHLSHALSQYLIYLYKNGIEEPDMTRFKFCSVNKDQGTLIVSDSIRNATDEEVKTEYAIVRASMGLPIPDPLPTIVRVTKPQEDKDGVVGEEENDNADS